MDFNITKIGGFIVLILIYLLVRKFFKKVADVTEKIGESTENIEELNRLKTKITLLEQKINNNP
jgi:cell shape-determining protein MreC